jgi:ABC-type dipeptide/oligopeptide/nickel transport system permease subunit
MLFHTRVNPQPKPHILNCALSVTDKLDTRNAADRLVGPSSTHLMGTDSLGRDVFTRVLDTRMTCGITLSIHEMDYVVATRSMGASDFRIMFYHILPGVLGPLIVLASLGVSGAIVTGASLSFLGLGVRPATPEWGAMLALNLIGDALRDALDPNTSTR